MSTSQMGSSGRPNRLKINLTSPWSWIGLLCIVELGLGHTGLFRHDQWRYLDLGPADLLCLLLQLAALESGGVEPLIAWRLQIARFGLLALQSGP
jgi:hypothetical protein